MSAERSRRSFLSLQAGEASDVAVICLEKARLMAIAAAD
jgi:hypothetical protein